MCLCVHDVVDLTVIIFICNENDFPLGVFYKPQVLTRAQCANEIINFKSPPGVHQLSA